MGDDLRTATEALLVLETQALEAKRKYFDEIAACSIPSTYTSGLYSNKYWTEHDFQEALYKRGPALLRRWMAREKELLEANEARDDNDDDNDVS